MKALIRDNIYLLVFGALTLAFIASDAFQHGRSADDRRHLNDLTAELRRDIRDLSERQSGLEARFRSMTEPPKFKALAEPAK